MDDYKEINKAAWNLKILNGIEKKLNGKKSMVTMIQQLHHQL